jgi:uncharacterized protein YacL
METGSDSNAAERTAPVAPRRERSSPVLLATRLLFVVLLVVSVMLTLASTSKANEFSFATVVGIIVAAGGFGLLVLILDALTPNKRITSVAAVYFGLCLGLVAALAIGSLLDTIANSWELGKDGPGALYLGLAKMTLGLTLCYLSVSMVITTKDDFRLVIPYVEFSKQRRGEQPYLLDTSALIDGRVLDLACSRLIDAPIIVPGFVLHELQTLSDSDDRGKRSRGRRGLDTLTRLQAVPMVKVQIESTRAQDGGGVDAALIEAAQRDGGRILTTDAGLHKVAQIRGVASINLNDLAASMRGTGSSGERLRVHLEKAGEQRQQAVGWLEDGTMVVVEDAQHLIGQDIWVAVTNTLQTAAGRLIFARHDPDPGSAQSLADAATGQERVGAESAPLREPAGPSGRNPRRGGR